MNSNPKSAGGKARARQFTSQSQSDAARALVNQRGPDYMRAIGKRGAKKFHALYKVAPVGTRGWVIVGRRTGEVIAAISIGSQDD